MFLKIVKKNTVLLFNIMSTNENGMHVLVDLTVWVVIM